MIALFLMSLLGQAPYMDPAMVINLPVSERVATVEGIDDYVAKEFHKEVNDNRVKQLETFIKIATKSPIQKTLPGEMTGLRRPLLIVEGKSKTGPPRFIFQSAETRKKFIAELQAELDVAKEHLKNGTPIPPVILIGGAKVGQVGIVRQAPWLGNPLDQTPKVLQVIGENRVLIEFPYHDDMVCIFEIPTKGMIDGRYIDLKHQWYEISGTETYKRAKGGTNTVFVVKPYEFKPKEAR